MPRLKQPRSCRHEPTGPVALRWPIFSLTVTADKSLPCPATSSIVTRRFAREPSNSFAARAGSARNHGALAEFTYFLRRSRKWWMTPSIVMLLLVGGTLAGLLLAAGYRDRTAAVVALRTHGH